MKIVVALTVLMLLLFAAPASADDGFDQYFATLRSEGINLDHTKGEMLAFRACVAAKQGFSTDEIVQYLSDEGSVSRATAHAILAAAYQSVCA